LCAFAPIVQLGSVELELLYRQASARQLSKHSLLYVLYILHTRLIQWAVFKLGVRV
jgi:hypothetical protein